MKPNFTALALLVAFLLSGGALAAAELQHWHPQPGARWQVQYSGRIDLSVAADIFNLDGFDTTASQVARIHAQGQRAVCYMDAGSWENWRPDAGEYPAAVKGKPLDGWPGERWLDIRRLDVLGPILSKRIAICAVRGFDAVDFDNVDGYANPTGFPLTATDQLRFNRWLATAAHKRGLAVGLKNDLGQITALEPNFDFAVNEECWTYRECARLRPFRTAGKPVLVIEYDPPLSAFCPTVKAFGFDGIRKHLSLDAYVARCR
jgi:hypothetical protein